MRDRVSIREIVKRATGGAPITHLNPQQPLYGDFTETGDLREIFERARLAEEAFESLPAEVRKAADNDPARLVEMVEAGDVAALEAAGVRFTSEDESPPAEPPTKGAEPARQAANKAGGAPAGAAASDSEPPSPPAS